MCSLARSNITDSLRQALCCSASGVVTDVECAICPNQDLAGIGVRLAFYVQSFLNGKS